MSKYIVMVGILLSATACGDTWGHRAVTGGAVQRARFIHERMKLSRSRSGTGLSSTA